MLLLAGLFIYSDLKGINKVTEKYIQKAVTFVTFSLSLFLAIEIASDSRRIYRRRSLSLLYD